MTISKALQVDLLVFLAQFKSEVMEEPTSLNNVGYDLKERLKEEMKTELVFPSLSLKDHTTTISRGHDFNLANKFTSTMAQDK